ncbi:MAG: hypothetical protein RL588_2170 [Pseudomonadota bacterium]|jgi:hypothetical protein
MTTTRHTEDDDFAGQLEALFGAPPAGLEAPALEAAILSRVRRRRRLRLGVISLSALVGLAIANESLSQAALPRLGVDRLLEAAGNSLSQTLYLSLGSGPLAAAATCGVLTVLGLAFARVLEEV